MHETLILEGTWKVFKPGNVRKVLSIIDMLYRGMPFGTWGGGGGVESC